MEKAVTDVQFDIVQIRSKKQRNVLELLSLAEF